MLPIVHHKPIAGETAVSRLQPNVPAVGFIVEVASKVGGDGFQSAKLVSEVLAQPLIVLAPD